MNQMFKAWFRTNKSSRFWRISKAIQERFAKQIEKAHEKVAS
jgi:hypothetical protein